MKQRRKYKPFAGKFSDEFLDKTKVICKCGHRVNFISRVPYIECSFCHNLIFRDKKAEYDYKVKRKLGVQI